jgi:phosphinothricin acetyltransferase
MGRSDDEVALGAGRLALAELLRAAEVRGFWKLVSRIFPENTASRALVRSMGFREVGVYEKHARLDGVWRDVIVVERLIPAGLLAEAGTHLGVRSESRG